MVNQLEAEYELELIGRGRKQLRKQLDKRVDKGYYSSAKPGRAVFYRYVERLAACLEEVTDQAREGLVKRTNISQLCT